MLIRTPNYESIVMQANGPSMTGLLVTYTRSFGRFTDIEDTQWIKAKNIKKLLRNRREKHFQSHRNDNIQLMTTITNLQSARDIIYLHLDWNKLSQYFPTLFASKQFEVILCLVLVTLV
jgi:hypothetical protein